MKSLLQMPSAIIHNVISFSIIFQMYFSLFLLICSNTSATNWLYYINYVIILLVKINIQQDYI